jgi:hypothetical protein
VKYVGRSDKLEEDDQFQTLADYGWKTVDSDQVSDLTPPYGDVYMNFKARKAIDAGNYMLRLMLLPTLFQAHFC